MAKTQSPKQAFISNILMLIVIFFAMNIMMKACERPPDPRNSVQILTDMRAASVKAHDLDIEKDNMALGVALKAEVDAKKLTQDEADKRVIEGQILTADSELTAGLYYSDHPPMDGGARMTKAYQGLERLFGQFRESPLWTTYAVTTPFQNHTWTPATLMDTIIKDLSAHNEKELTYGIFPGYKIIDFIVHLTGAQPGFSYWFACLLLALCVRALVFPLTQKQLMWGRQMSQLTPLLKEIKAKYTDQQEQQLKTMALYKEYGLNPYAGCLPAVVQLPLFLTVYQFMLHYRFTFSLGTFLWIHPGTLPWMAANLGLQDKTLIVVYGVTMLVSTLLTPVSDPTQVLQQRITGVAIALMFAGSMLVGAFPVPAAFVLYWTFTNLLATAQSLRAYRMPLPPLQKVVAPTGGVYPKEKPGFMGKLQEMMEEQQRKEAILRAEKEGTPLPEDTAANSNGKPKPTPNTPKRTGNPNIRRPKRRK